MKTWWKLPAVILAVIVLAIPCFPVVVLAQGPVDGYEQADFVKIAGQGLGDPMNNYAWSMAEFKGDIYVGTVRNFLYGVGLMLKQQGVIPPDFNLPFITRPEGDLVTQPWAEDMRGEIWRYHQGQWARVFRSGVTHLPGQWIPDEPGFRAMATFTDKWGVEALYAATGVGYLPQHLLMKSVDGAAWNRVVTPMLMGSDSRSMITHNGRLYIAAAIANPGAAIWATDDPQIAGTGDNWEQVADFTSIGPGTNVAVVSLASLNGYLYAGTQNDSGFQVFRSNARVPDNPRPGEWTQVVSSGAGDMSNTRALTMQVFKDSLYVGSSCFPITSDDPPQLRGPKGFELIRIDADTDRWELLIGDPYAWLPPGERVFRRASSGWPGGFGNILNYYCWSMQEDNGVLYLGTFDASSFLKFLPVDQIVEILGWDQLSHEQQEQIRQQMILGIQQAIDRLEGIPGGDSYRYGFDQILIKLQTVPCDWRAVWTALTTSFVGADLWKTGDGVNWQQVTLNGFDNPANYGIRTMAGGSLYIGTANPFGGFEVYQTHVRLPAASTWSILIMTVLFGAFIGILVVKKRRWQ